MYHKKEEKSIDPLDPKEVFRVHHDDIPKGVTQCKRHKWVKLNDTELKCVNCPTVIIVGADDIEKLCQ